MRRNCTSPQDYGFAGDIPNIDKFLYNKLILRQVFAFCPEPGGSITQQRLATVVWNAGHREAFF